MSQAVGGTYTISIRHRGKEATSDPVPFNASAAEARAARDQAIQRWEELRGH